MAGGVFTGSVYTTTRDRAIEPVGSLRAAKQHHRANSIAHSEDMDQDRCDPGSRLGRDPLYPTVGEIPSRTISTFPSATGSTRLTGGSITTSHPRLPSRRRSSITRAGLTR